MPNVTSFNLHRVKHINIKDDGRGQSSWIDITFADANGDYVTITVFQPEPGYFKNDFLKYIEEPDVIKEPESQIAEPPEYEHEDKLAQPTDPLPSLDDEIPF